MANGGGRSKMLMLFDVDGTLTKPRQDKRLFTCVYEQEQFKSAVETENFILNQSIFDLEGERSSGLKLLSLYKLCLPKLVMPVAM